ncbi:site-2 protease family protein [Amphibacillus sp. Q70]|uniref:site-2 protease family protein n=1 Tax=Amphibacillus sp. Q70 TaxID=3453416 RepID=UPI003F8548F5
MLQDMLGYCIGLFVYSPINILIHECGHAFFVKLFGGKIRNISIGTGEPKLTWGKIIINKYFFLFGLADFDRRTLKVDHKFAIFLIFLGGALFNIITLIVVILIFNQYDPGHFLKGYYIGFTITLIVSALVPMTYPHGYDSDGKHIIRLFTNKF